MIKLNYCKVSAPLSVRVLEPFQIRLKPFSKSSRLFIRLSMWIAKEKRHSSDLSIVLLLSTLTNLENNHAATHLSRRSLSRSSSVSRDRSNKPHRSISRRALSNDRKPGQFAKENTSTAKLPLREVHSVTPFAFLKISVSRALRH